LLLDQEASKNFFEHTLELWFNPELERQRGIGLVADNYQPEAMQVILFPHGDHSILFDGDVIPKEKLEANRNYKDCGFVIFKKEPNGNWEGYFDFRYNKGRAEELFNSALEFFETAKEAYRAGRIRPFLDNLFSATELLVQSMLFVMTANQKYVEDPNHRWTLSELGRVAKMLNRDNNRYNSLLGNLSRLRDEGRYHKRPLSVAETEAQQYINTVEEVVQEVRSEIS
jgi:HEPN domain-containing protein